MCSIFKIALSSPLFVSHDLLSDVLEVAAVQVLRKSTGASSMDFSMDFSMEGNRVAKESLREFGISDAINIIYIYVYLSKPFKWRLKLKKSIEHGGGGISLCRDLRTWLEGIAMGHNNPQQTS